MQENYSTTDIVLAATLRIKGYQIKTIEINGTKGTFVFEQIAPELLMEYYLSQIVVEPVAFNNMIKQLTTSVRRMVNS